MLNNEAVGFIHAWGQTVDWEPIFDDDSVSISVAPIDALLAMKLNAARPGRDTDDIAKLLSVAGIDSLEGAESVYESFYPRDSLSERSVRQVRRILELGLPDAPTPPSPADLH